MSVGIVGGGVGGLVAARELAAAGLEVAVYEGAPKLGGLAGSLATLDGQEVERYYHFVCKPDRAYLETMRELGIEPRLKWATTKMGFYNGSLCELGDPLSLLRFPGLAPSDKLKFAWATLRAKLRKADSWQAIEDVPARDWLIGEYGERTYELVFRPLLELKFHDDQPLVSAAWMFERINRLGNSRTWTQRERIGYLEGGSATYIGALQGEAERLGAEINLGRPVEEIVVEGERVVGLRWQGGFREHDTVLSAVAVPVLLELLPFRPEAYFAGLRSLRYTDVLVVLMRLRQRFSPYFWMNINHPQIGLAGIIEYTNLNPCPELRGDHLLYIPQYLPSTHPLYRLDDHDLVDLYCGFLQRINPAFDRAWIRESWVARDRFAQPICEAGFSRNIPEIRTPIQGLYLIDAHQFHPQDRTVSNSTLLGKKAGRLIAAERRGQGAPSRLP